MPYEDYTDQQDQSDQQDTFVPDVTAAARTAQYLQQQGIQLAQPASQLPPLNIAALMQMNPLAAAQVVRSRRLAQERENAANNNYQSLLSLALQNQRQRSQTRQQASEYDRRMSEQRANRQADIDAKQKEAEAQWEAQGNEFASEWSKVLDENRAAADMRDKAAANLDEIKKFGLAQMATGNVTPAPTKERPNPKAGIFTVVPFKFAPGPSDPNADKSVTQTKDQVASVLNDEYAKRTEEFNKALAQFNEAQKKTLDLHNQTFSSTRGALRLAPDASAMVDLRTRKVYPLPQTQPKNRTLIYDPTRARLFPK